MAWSDELVPENLLGHQRTALVAVDDQGRVSSFNRASSVLLGIDPARFTDSSLPVVVKEPALDDWLYSSSQNASYHVGRETMPLDVKCVHTTPGLKVVAITDAGPRLRLHAETQGYESGVRSDFIDWDAKTRSMALLQFFQEYVENPPSIGGVFEMARRTGSHLFPAGGAIYQHKSDGVFEVCETWGETFVEASFRPHRGDLSDESARLLDGEFGQSFSFEGGLVALKGEVVDTRLADLFVQTIDLGLVNQRLT